MLLQVCKVISREHPSLSNALLAQTLLNPTPSNSSHDHEWKTSLNVSSSQLVEHAIRKQIRLNLMVTNVQLAGSKEVTVEFTVNIGVSRDIHILDNPLPIATRVLH